MDGDGKRDLITGHYWPGDIFLFRNESPGKYAPMENLEDETGRNLNAGEPWYYVKFESEDPLRPVRMVEAEMTPELRSFCQGVDGVIHFANRTFSLFETAKRRRPARLLKVVER